MTQERIMELAWNELLMRWGREKEHYESHQNEIAKYRMEKAWNEMKELEAIIRGEKEIETA